MTKDVAKKAQEYMRTIEACEQVIGWVDNRIHQSFDPIYPLPEDELVEVRHHYEKKRQAAELDLQNLKA